MLEILLKEIVEERADHRDGAEFDQIVAGRRDDAADDVGGELELEPQQQPHPVALPDRLALASLRVRPQENDQHLDERFERRVGNDEDGAKLDQRRRVTSGDSKQFFLPSQTCLAGGRTMQRKPTCVVDVSTGSG